MSKSTGKLNGSPYVKEHMKDTMKQLIEHSPDYRLSKLNNYDNTVKNMSLNTFQNCDLTRLYPRDDSQG